MNNSIVNKIKGKLLVKAVACALVATAVIIKMAELGYEFGQWLKMH